MVTKYRKVQILKIKIACQLECNIEVRPYNITRLFNCLCCCLHFCWIVLRKLKVSVSSYYNIYVFFVVQPLSSSPRILVGEGVLTKVCRKKLKQRQFFLFSDILVYGNIVISKKKVVSHSLFFMLGFLFDQIVLCTGYSVLIWDHSF